MLQTYYFHILISLSFPRKTVFKSLTETVGTEDPEVAPEKKEKKMENTCCIFITIHLNAYDLCSPVFLLATLLSGINSNLFFFWLM